MVPEIRPLSTTGLCDQFDQFVWYASGFWTIAAVVEAADAEWQRVNGGVNRTPDAALRVCAVLVDVLVASAVTSTVFVMTLYVAQFIQVL